MLLNISFNTHSVHLAVWLSVKLLAFLKIQLSCSPYYIMHTEVPNGVFFSSTFSLTQRYMYVI